MISDLGYNSPTSMDIHALPPTRAPVSPIGASRSAMAADHTMAPQLRHRAGAQAPISNAIPPNMAQIPQGVSIFTNASSTLRNQHKVTVDTAEVTQSQMKPPPYLHLI